ncbi:alpha/beta fold hydrolase [Thaumasiovibrio sp. DFM-14]|uniref:alpha/beta fold hydrolase n=1 Tax=Thaumasiovibrio sp. DFM-14 TaxID=3384792 RepID=UPI0039A0292D
MLVLLAVVVMVGCGMAYAVLCYLNSEEEELRPEMVNTEHGDLALLSAGHVFYSLYGDRQRPVVVLIHGFSFPSFAWERNVDALTKAGYCVLTYDIYGRGFSARPNVAYNRETFIQQLRELLDYLAIEQPIHLVGLSMGGAIASAFANDFPSRVASVSFIAPFHAPINIGPLKWPIIGTFLARAFYIPRLASKLLDDLAEPDKHFDIAHRYEVQMRYKGFSRGLIRSARTFLQYDPAADLKALGDAKVNTLLLWGENDQIFPVEKVSYVSDLLGDSNRVCIIEGAGHAPQFESSHTVNQCLTRFLSGCDLVSEH